MSPGETREALGLDHEYTRLAFYERVAALGNITVADCKRGAISACCAQRVQPARAHALRGVFDTAHQPPWLVSEHDLPIEAQQAGASLPGAKTIGPYNGNAECVDYAIVHAHD